MEQKISGQTPDEGFLPRLLWHRPHLGTSQRPGNRQGDRTTADERLFTRCRSHSRKELKALKPNIEGWEADFGKETMTKGKAYLNMTWSGDAVWAIEEAGKVGVELGYEVPKEGSNVWFDGWVIPKYSRNPKAAAYFINYLCQEDVALANMETTGYVSSVAGKKVLEAMSDTEAYPKPVNLAYFLARKAEMPISTLSCIQTAA